MRSLHFSHTNISVLPDSAGWLSSGRGPGLNFRSGAIWPRWRLAWTLASGLDAGDNRLSRPLFDLVHSIGTDAPFTRVMGRFCDRVQLIHRPKRPGGLSNRPGHARKPRISPEKALVADSGQGLCGPRFRPFALAGII